VRLDCNDIVWLEADGNYTTINLVNMKRRVVRMSLSELLVQLPLQQFIRIHKSFVINKKHITEIRANSIMILNEELPVGRSYQQGLQAFF
jgi:DNA-binding LytR/AlgR family response regulator